MIKVGERLLLIVAHTPSSEFVAGLVLTVITVSTFGISSWIVLLWLRTLNPTLALVVGGQELA